MPYVSLRAGGFGRGIGRESMVAVKVSDRLSVGMMF